MCIQKQSIVVAVIIGFSAPAQAALFGPENYDECILESMKGVTSNVAASAIMKACRSKFPAAAPAAEIMPPDALRRIAANVTINGTKLSGTVQNGNSTWTVTSLTFALIPKAKENQLGAWFTAEAFPVAVKLGPMSSGEVAVTVEAIAEPLWRITAAQGIKNQ